MTSWSQWRRGRFWAEVVLAVVVGVAAFVVAALVSTAARSHVPAALLGLLLFLLLVVLAVAGFATRASRRAAGSEQTRGVLAEEQAALRRMATLVARQPSPAEVFAAVTEETTRAARLLHIDSAHLVVYEQDQTATVVGSWNLRGPPMPVGERAALDGDNIIARVFQTQRPVRIDNYSHASGLVAEKVRSIGVRAAVGVPVLVGGRLWGVMAVGSSRAKPLPADTERRIGAFTELVGTAIANAAARTELERVAAEQAALGRVATLVAEAVPPGDIFAAVAAEVAELFGVPLVGLFRYEREDAATVVGGAGRFSSYLGHPWPCPAGDPGLVASVQRTGQPVRIDDYTQIKSATIVPVGALGIGKAAGVPIIVGGRLWGAVVVAAGYEHPPFPADTLDRLTIFTELIATAIANSDARTEIERLAGEQAALRRVATLVARGAETGEVFAAVAHEVAEVMHLPVAAVQRFEDDDSATVTAAWSDRPHPYQPGTRWPYHASGLGAQVRQTGRAGRIKDFSHRRGVFAAKARELGLHSIAAAPIIVDGAVWGLVTVASTDGPLPDQTEDRLAEFTELVGTAIANAQSRTELSASRARIVAAADETRRRIEHDLHDGIQQRLVSLALKAQMIKTMTPRPADQIQGELSRLANGLGTALDELREISHGIHPGILSDYGLGPALEALALRSAVPVELNLNLGSRLNEHVEAAGYYIASEAITNVAKHAQASVIDLCVDARDGAFTLSVSDDGVGGADPSRGSGIIGLRDRVEALGGTLLVLSPPGRGTTLHVHLPADPMTAATLPGGTS